MAVFIPDDMAQLKVLIDLADHPSDVASTTDYGRFAVIVPDELLERFERFNALQESPSPVEPARKRGRS